MIAVSFSFGFLLPDYLQLVAAYFAAACVYVVVGIFFRRQIAVFAEYLLGYVPLIRTYAHRNTTACRDEPRYRHYGDPGRLQQLFGRDGRMCGFKSEKIVFVHLQLFRSAYSLITLLTSCIAPSISYMLLTVPTFRSSLMP